MSGESLSLVFNGYGGSFPREGGRNLKISGLVKISEAIPLLPTSLVV
jgi:hypothetical protein